MGDSERTHKNQLLRVFMTCRDGLVRSLLKMRARQEDVDDILQETFLRVLHANRKSQIKSPQGYLFTVSRNLVLEKLNARSREISTEINDALLGSDESSAERALYYQQKFAMFNDALRALPEKKRRAILLRKFYGLSHKDIAKKMNVSVGSVEKYISSGIKQCKRSLSSKGYEFDSRTDGPPKDAHRQSGRVGGKES